MKTPPPPPKQAPMGEAAPRACLAGPTLPSSGSLPSMGGGLGADRGAPGSAGMWDPAASRGSWEAGRDGGRKGAFRRVPARALEARTPRLGRGTAGEGWPRFLSEGCWLLRRGDDEVGSCGLGQGRRVAGEGGSPLFKNGRGSGACFHAAASFAPGSARSLRPRSRGGASLSTPEQGRGVLQFFLCPECVLGEP